MNLLAHLYLAERSHTSAAGQVLGDIVKGRLDGGLPAEVERGVRLHRAIDRASDAHAAHHALRASFDAPYRRYAGILVDIGFDYSLARTWPRYADEALERFALRAEQRVTAEWPDSAPLPVARMRGLRHTLAGYRHAQGIQRALDSVAGRLSRRNPVAGALPLLLARRDAFDAELPTLLHSLERLVETA